MFGNVYFGTYYISIRRRIRRSSSGDSGSVSRTVSPSSLRVASTSELSEEIMVSFFISSILIENLLDGVVEAIVRCLNGR